jgi:DNA-binding PadR family transcriptional regulator
VSVPHALLALLREEPKYGMRLQNEFEARTGEVWPLNVGQVYTTLQRLERDGLVETDDGESERSRKRYRITAAGERELVNWLRTPPDFVPPPRDELVIKVLVALQVPGIDIHEILQVHRRRVIEVMQRYTRTKRRPKKRTWRWRWSPMPSSSGWKGSFAGSTPPTSG